MNWVAHFQNRPEIDIGRFSAEQLSIAEQKRVGRSISLFQRGESSEAKDYLEKSERFAQEIGDPAFYAETRLFVKEENFHAHLLEIFMRQMHIDLAAQAWSDNVFRRLRSPGDIGWSSRVLLTAEILAQVYYPALKEATGSEMLRAICARVIEDEDYHILFQTERIARVLQARHPLYGSVHAVLGFILFWGTTMVVWFEHRKVLASVFSFRQYVRDSLARYRFAMQQLSTRRTSPDVWLRMQARYDLEMAQNKFGDKIEQEVNALDQTQ